MVLAFCSEVSSIYLHMYSRLSGVGGQAKLRCHLPDALPWWLSPPGFSVCQHNLEMSIDCFSKLGIPLHPHKQEGPSTCLTILGIEVDSLKVARYSFSRSIPSKFERKLRRHKQRFGKIDTTVVLDKDENLLWSGLQWHRSCHSNEMMPLPILLAAVFLGTGNCSSKIVYWSFFLL